MTSTPAGSHPTGPAEGPCCQTCDLLHSLVDGVHAATAGGMSLNVVERLTAALLAAAREPHPEARGWT